MAGSGQCPPVGRNQGEVVRTISVVNELGVHARPAASIAREAQKYSASVTLSHGDRKVDAKSILDILTLAACKGSSVIVEARGDDAEAAAAGIERLFHERFGEDR
ncbi:MAG: HPr family phosphocarrier protein [Deltaproteobacteria bacterium]|nr:HPr family phosphocarrier protein [Deltaproteobacteria bacterium]